MAEVLENVCSCLGWAALAIFLIVICLILATLGVVAVVYLIKMAKEW